jgi:hypothetical protein
MPVTYSSYSVEEMKLAINTALSDTALPRGSVLMLDLERSLSLPDRQAEDMRDMARFLASRRIRFSSRLGMVAPDEQAYDKLTLGAIVVERAGITAKIFRDFESARAWLLLDPPNG